MENKKNERCVHAAHKNRNPQPNSSGKHNWGNQRGRSLRHTTTHTHFTADAIMQINREKSAIYWGPQTKGYPHHWSRWPVPGKRRCKGATVPTQPFQRQQQKQDQEVQQQKHPFQLTGPYTPGYTESRSALNLDADIGGEYPA